MPTARVSIIIPFKNTAAYIAACITSIIHQTYSDWEALFVNDNSNDDSSNIVKIYAKHDLRIRYLDSTGDGIITALQTAFTASKGDYITRMDSDDIMAANRIEVMLSQLQKHGLQHIALGQVKYFRAGGISTGYARYERWINHLTQTGTNYSEIYKECVIPSPCWMLHRKDFIACDGFNPNRYPEDYDLAFRFYKAGFTCIPCENILLYWRDYNTRTSRTHEHYAINYFIDLKIHYFLELDYDNNRSLTVWGAGYKGKTVAKLLIKNRIPFVWVCDNKNKIGQVIYGQTLLHYKHLATLNSPQSIVTVANGDAQRDIKTYLKNYKMQAMVDYFFFC